MMTRDTPLTQEIPINVLNALGVIDRLAMAEESQNYPLVIEHNC